LSVDGLNIHIDSYTSKGYNPNETAIKIRDNSYEIIAVDTIIKWSFETIVSKIGNYIDEYLSDFLRFGQEFGIEECINRLKQIKMQKYVQLLESCKNLIFTGAPGTGKTYLAKQIAKQMIGVATDEELEQSEQFAFVQFHPSYDYTDFVEGLRPTKPDSNGNIGFELKDGVFKEFCKKAKQPYPFTLEGFKTYLEENEKQLEDSSIQQYVSSINSLSKKYGSLDAVCEHLEETEKNKTNNNDSTATRKLIKFKQHASASDKTEAPYVFIIDEINRGEISKIFGELFFSIDPSYRGKKGAVETQYANMHEVDEIFYIPENVYIIGTMNDIDRSVESFDFAMRRRFTWEEITAEESAKNMDLPKEIKDRMAKLNTQLSKIEGLNASYKVGGAYFLDADGKPRTYYETIWKFRLEPLLKEYLRGMSEAEKKLENLKNAYNAETNNGQ
jgi:hypothetical protein